MYSVTQDAYGFIWIATAGGVARYDGTRFVPLESLIPDQGVLTEGAVCVYADQQHGLWIASANPTELIRVDLQTNVVTRIAAAPNNNAGNPRIWESPTGEIWFSLQDGLGRYSYQDRRYQHFPLFLNGTPAQVFQFCPGPDEALWVVTGNHLLKFDPLTGQYQRDRTGHPGQPLFHTEEGLLTAIRETADGRFWISNWYEPGQGLMLYDPRQERVLKRYVTAGQAQAGEIPGGEIRQIRVNRTGLWLAGNTGGLSYLDLAHDTLLHWTYTPEQIHGLSDAQIMDFFQDQAGNWWIPTANQLNYADLHETHFDLLTHVPGQPNSLIDNLVYSLALLPDDRLLIGTKRGVSLYTPQTETFFNFQLPGYNHNEYNNQILTMLARADGTAWLGTWSGLSQVRLSDGKLVRQLLGDINVGLPPGDPRYYPSLGAIMELFGTLRGPFLLQNNFGLLRLFPGVSSPDRLPFTPLEQSMPQDASPLIPYAALDSGAYLISHRHQFARFSAHDLRILPLSFPTADSLLTQHALTDFILADDRTGWFLADNQVYRIALPSGRITRQPLPPSLATQTLVSLFPDRSGDLWLSTLQGVGHFRPATHQATFFDAAVYLNGNVDSEEGTRHFVQATDGTLYLAGNKGVTVIHPEALVTNTFVPPVYITELRANNQSLSFDSSLTVLRNVQLPYDQNNLYLRLAALNFTVPAQNQYAYRLREVDTTWVHLGYSNELRLSNLAPGRYTLQVRAANNDGVWNEEGLQLSLLIAPPWWKTGGAYAGYLVLLLGMGYAVLWFLLRQRMARNEAERLRQLDEVKSRFFTNITHEFRTPLTVIQGYARQTEDGAGYLSRQRLRQNMQRIYQQSQQLLTLINQILDLNKLDAEALPIQLESADLILFLRYLTESFRSLAQDRGIHLQFKTNQAAFPARFDPDKWQSIVSNLVSNALKFTPAEGAVQVQVTLYHQHQKRDANTQEDWLSLSVRDTGVAIPLAEQGRIFDRFYQADTPARRVGKGTGIGLSLTRQFVEQLGGTISVHSAEGSGTTFTVDLPVQGLPPETSLPHAISFLQENVEGTLPSTEHQSPPVPAHPDEEPYDDGRPLVLVVEDTPEVTRYLVSCLESRYQLITAGDGSDGIKQALARVPDVIISDIMMPRTDGYTLVRTLKQDVRTSHIPILMLTAKATQSDKVAGLKTGADAYLIKPFDPEELLVRLEQLLRLRRRLQQHYSQHVAPTGPPSPTLTETTENEFLTRLQALVEAHLDQPGFGADELATALSMSRTQLYRKLRAVLDTSVNHYIRSVRLQVAQQMLCNPSLTITEVAYAVGFSSPQYFSRTFSETVGQSPTEWREQRKHA
ncbi:Signal transduction histidine kinase [Catalinimonas alkaloidigena]|uniref:histidine kinase n=2 Tax=Catalinimonas alkaloidigena TaxID=1075417 RepID=A0A1G9TPD1_9BACT|nr:Signal transduction histidine kinase [Catalinimonas alkaloidigena]